MSDSAGESILPVAPDRSPHIRDFTDLGEDSFIENAYRIALKRGPDPAGGAHYRGLLTQGISKAEILTYLIDSPEGRPIGTHIEGLTRARRWAKFCRLPIVNRWVALGRRIYPIAALRRDLRAAKDLLAHVTAQVQALELEVEQRDVQGQRRLENLRSELMHALATRAGADSLASLQAGVADLGARITKIRKLQESKADQASLDLMRDEWRTTLYRGIDDVDRRFRILLDAKAGLDAVAEAGITFEGRLDGLHEGLDRQLDALEARKADTNALDAVRGETLAAVRAIDELDKVLRLLLEGKADADMIDAIGTTFAGHLRAVQEGLQREVQSLDARKADTNALDAVRHEMLAALGSLDEMAEALGLLSAGKAGTDLVNELGATFENRLQAVQQELQRQVQSVDARKADANALDAARNEMLAALGSIDAMDKALRVLCEGKAGTDLVNEVGAAFATQLRALQEELQRQVQSVEVRKADTSAMDASRNEMLAALRTALTGMTGSVLAVSASKVDRATMMTLLAENSKSIVSECHNSIEQLRSSIGGLSRP